MEPKLDLIVVGGGPAGTASAITAAKAGLTVALLVRSPAVTTDIADEPLQSVHPGLETLLNLFGAEKAVTYASRATYSGIQSGNDFTPLSNNANETWYGHHISRDAFDFYLSFSIRKHPVEVITDDPIVHFYRDNIVLTSGRTLKFRYMIDGTGRSRFLGKRLKLKEEFYSPPLTTWSGVVHNLPASFFDRFLTSFTPEVQGWTWLAPEPPLRCTWTRLGLTKKVQLQSPEFLKAYTHPGAKVKSANVRWRMFSPFVSPNILLTGDAAGILDPGAGQGILNACWSGIAAANAIVRASKFSHSETTALRAYEEWFVDNYRSKAEQLKTYYENLNIVF